MAKPGPEPGTRPSGRPKGSPNKTTVELKAAIAAVCGEDYDPVVGMAMVDRFGLYPTYHPVTKEFIGNTEVDPTLRQKCAKEVAEYLHPKRKSIDLQTPPGEELNVRINNDTQAACMLQSMLGALVPDLDEA